MGGTNKENRQSPSTTENASAKKQKASYVSSSSPSSSLSARYITDNDNNLINNNNEGLLFAFVKFMDLPVPIRVSIFNCLGQTQEELMNLTLVSKRSMRIA